MSGVGTRIASLLKSVGIEPVYGCGCQRTLIELDNTPVQEIRTNVDYWAEVLHTNAKAWRALKGGAWSVMPNPPIALCKRSILWACDQEENPD